MRRAATISVLTLLLHSNSALPQQSPAAGTIEGTVVRSDTGEPLANAQVSLTTTSAGAQPLGAGPVGEFSLAVAPGTAAPPVPNRPRTFQPVTTGADGKFSFKDIDPGTYRVAATANGFVRQEHGQRVLTGPGRPLFLTAGQSIKNAAIRLPAVGSVSGRVFDENDQPATGAPIQLLRATYNAQGRNFQSAGTGYADDRGDYRVFGVIPGRYYLVAGTPLGLSRPIALGGGPAGSARFSMVYYPNVSNLDQASTIEVRAGAEAFFDMRVRRQPQTYRVRGRVVDSTGAALPANVTVMLVAQTFTGSSGTGARILDPAAGTFELQNVPSGDYTLQVELPVQNQVLRAGPLDGAAARQAEQASLPSAQLPIHVVNADLENLVLPLSTGVSTTGRILVEGQPVSSVPNIERLRLTITPYTPAMNQTPPAATTVAADGTFQVVGLREGDYRVLFSAVPGSYVKSIQYGGDDILNKPFKFSGSGSGTFEVTLRTGAAQVGGTVSDVNSQPVPGIPVVFIPAQRNRTDLYRTAVTDQNGRFALTNFAPGHYRAFSWEGADNNAYFDPEFLKHYEQLGKAVQVMESSNSSVDVKLIPAPQP